MAFDFINTLPSCTLEELESMQLLERFEFKYLLTQTKAEMLIKNLRNQESIQVLEVKEQRIVHYSSDYYDTPSFTSFREHHSRRLNRLKIRTRSYSTSDTVWQEEKWRTNKNQVVKIRVPIEDSKMLGWDELKSKSKFPERYTGISPSLNVEYDRITIVDNDFKEKMTLDFNLVQQNSKKLIHYDNLVIVEVKQPSKSFRQKFNIALKEVKGLTTSFSKYCIGLSYLKDELKSNLFKPQQIHLNKLFNPVISTK